MLEELLVVVLAVVVDMLLKRNLLAFYQIMIIQLSLVQVALEADLYHLL